MLPDGDEPLTLEHWIDRERIRVIEEPDFDDRVRGIYAAPRGQKLIIVNKRLRWDLKRDAMWHELAHALLNHHDLAMLCTIDGWWTSRIEQAAERLAAKMALPDGFLAGFRVVRDGARWSIPERDGIMGEIADAAGITEELVLKRLGLLDLNGRPRPWVN